FGAPEGLAHPSGSGEPARVWSGRASRDRREEPQRLGAASLAGRSHGVGEQTNSRIRGPPRDGQEPSRDRVPSAANWRRQPGESASHPATRSSAPGSESGSTRSRNTRLTVHSGNGRPRRRTAWPASTVPSSSTRRYQPVRPVSVTRARRLGSFQRFEMFAHGPRGFETWTRAPPTSKT